MISETEKIKILQMIQDGKITPEQGIELLNAFETSKTEKQKIEEETRGVENSNPQWLRIVVTDLSSGKKKVNVRLPAGLINTGTRFGARFTTDLHHLSPDRLKDLVRSGKTGLILDMVDEESNEHVEMYLE